MRTPRTQRKATAMSAGASVRGAVLAAAVVGSAGLFDASTGTSSSRAELLRPVAPLAPVVGAASGPLDQFTTCVWSNGGTTYDLSSMTAASSGQGEFCEWRGVCRLGATPRGVLIAVTSASLPRRFMLPCFLSSPPPLPSLTDRPPLAAYKVTDVRDSTQLYYFNVCGGVAAPPTDGDGRRCSSTGGPGNSPRPDNGYPSGAWQVETAVSGDTSTLDTCYRLGPNTNPTGGVTLNWNFSLFGACAALLCTRSQIFGGVLNPAYLPSLSCPSLHLPLSIYLSLRPSAQTPPFPRAA